MVQPEREDVLVEVQAGTVPKLRVPHDVTPIPIAAPDEEEPGDEFKTHEEATRQCSSIADL